MDLKDWIFIGILSVNGIALSVNILALFLTRRSIHLTRRSIHRQSNVTDIRLYFQITEKLTDTWRHYKDSEEKARNFELVEVLNLLESLCRLHSERRFHGTTQDMVKEYLLEIIPEIVRDDHVREALQANRSGSDTYGYIRRFARSNNIENFPSW